MKMKKVYIVRKYVWAESAEEAIKKSKRQKVDDCWADDATNQELLKAKMTKQLEMGFKKK